MTFDLKYHFIYFYQRCIHFGTSTWLQKLCGRKDYRCDFRRLVDAPNLMHELIRIIGYFFLFAFISCHSSKSKDEKFYAETQKGVINFLLEKEIIQLKYSGIIIPDTISFLNIENEIVELSSIKDKRNIYFCFDPTSSCSLCVQIAAEIILEASKDPGISFIIISKFHSTKDMKIFLNSHELNELDNVTILSGGFDDIGLKIIYPTFFILDESNRTEMVYIHDMSYSGTTKKYIKLLMEKLALRFD